MRKRKLLSMPDSLKTLKSGLEGLAEAVQSQTSDEKSGFNGVRG